MATRILLKSASLCGWESATTLLAKHGQAAPIDLGAVKNEGLKQATAQMAYLVDMAKAEALEEIGDREGSLELAGRYL